MSLLQSPWSQSRAELLMDITAGLADLTQRPEDVDRVPAYLSERLELAPLTLALVRERAEGAQTVLNASSGALAQAPEAAREVIAAYLRRQAADASPTATLVNMAHGEFPRATIFAQRVDVGFQMLLIAHHRAGDEALDRGWKESLQAIARQAAKFLAGITIWLYRPEGMGAPFDRLTHREWTVLRGLSTGAGEKQLADQLQLSPHTLHSHIKSIYRKTGIPGRVPLLLSAQEALRALRCQGLHGYGTRKANIGVVMREKAPQKSAPAFS